MARAWIVFGRWLRLRRRIGRWGRAVTNRVPASEQPLRAVLFNVEQMELHGKALARSHKVHTRRTPDLLLARLDDNETILSDARRSLTAMVRDEVRITPAGDWLLDNYYLIEEQIRTARLHLPRGYSRELPSLAIGASAGLPRVFDLAMQAIAHGDGRVDAETMSRLTAAYQSVTPLKLGELWAIPIMLRLALIENLRRMSVLIMRDSVEHGLAAEWAARLDDVAERDPKSVVLVLADMARSNLPLTGPFVSELMRGLHGRSAALAMPMSWIEQWVADGGHGAEQLIHAESQQQAADQVSISNSIGSLRFLINMNWREFVEALSIVERTLLEDPARIYASMDFHTRDNYRHAVESLARAGGVSEVDVARIVVELAGVANRADPIAAHVGYYLIDDGIDKSRAAIAAASGARPKWRRRPRRVSLWAYLLPIALLDGFFVIGLTSQMHGVELPTPVYASVVALAIVVFGELGIALVNWAATKVMSPQALPCLDFSGGIPIDARTIVVVPSMLGSQAAIDALVEALEVRFLANRDPNLQFALLTDFLDADDETLPTDTSLVTHAAQRIDVLNDLYAPDLRDRFFLLHRPRLWNVREGKWLGYERKRGKLEALNELLRGRGRERFMQISGNVDSLMNVQYVITLDTDTQLPRDAARELAATLAHPLNRARLDPHRRRVVRGYGILQPTVGASMSGLQASRYARMYGSEPGIDPYTRMVSDVYQDLFGEGSFIGKGIYDVDVIVAVLHGRFPEDRVLSHDLLEGCYTRAGLVSDVRLYESYPSRYAADITRQARWIRGDWQLLPWMLPWVPRGLHGHEWSPLSWLSRGKLLDNLRRSLVPVAATALLVIGWIILPEPLEWTLWLVCLLLLPVLVPAIRDVLVKPLDMTLEAHLLQVGQNFARGLERAVVDLACLPHRAYVSVVAIAVTLWRVLISRRHLLQWNPSSEAERRLGKILAAELQSMWFAAVFALLTAAVVWRANAAAFWVAAPICMLWLFSPVLMTWLGRPPGRRQSELSAAQLTYLRSLARRIWAYFEIHVGPQDNWLPPDNLQEHPSPLVANRTSPTNIGLSLLSGLAACDFGYLSSGAMIERTSRTLATLEKLSRHRGHFFNWYDTQTLAPLAPRYISTVDSGNLAAHLLTLRQGLLALLDAAPLSLSVFDGLTDTLAVLEQSRRDVETDNVALAEALKTFSNRLETACTAPMMSLEWAAQQLDQLAQLAGDVESTWPPTSTAEAEVPTAHWPTLLRIACQDARDEALRFVAQADSVEPPQASANDRRNAAQVWPSLRDLQRSPIATVRAAAIQRVQEIERLASLAVDCARVEYGFLYDRDRHLLSIGYNLDERRLDPGYYDLLASEARLCSYLAIAQGELPEETWFALGRLLTEVDGEATLLSWSGSMFEYLMPQLVMPSYPDTLLDQTARHAVRAQVRYGARRDVPWGMSESGYNAVDARMNYQYRAFGVPDLGLKRGLGQDLVIAPYASMLALMVSPAAACENLQRLEKMGFAGRYGLYEAIDYTPARVPPGQEHVLVRSFMSHHQGMGLLSLLYLLQDQPMQKRFVADAELRATLLLLQERIPRAGVFYPHDAEDDPTRADGAATESQLRIYRTPNASRPAIQMLSNGRYHALLTGAGSGYSRLREMAVTRWREDGTRDPWGSFCYLRDVESGEFWSAAYQPTCSLVSDYEAIFSDAKAEYRGRRRSYDMHLEIAISAEDDIELRRLHITNRAAHARTIEITTYAEVVLAPAISDELHPAFSNLFVQTEIVRPKQALLCTRRPRSQDEVMPWMFHLVAVHDAAVDAISYETDRGRFLGRGNTARAPLALTDNGTLSDTDGSVLDPIVAIRCRVTLAPEQSAIIDMVTGVSMQRETCAQLIDKYRDRHLADRVFDLAWTHSEVVRRQINATPADARLFERLAAPVVYSSSFLRAEPAVLLQNRRGQSGLWGHSISGDLPIVLLRVAAAASIDLVRQLIQAHAYWRLKGLDVDLVIWNEEQAGYRQELQDQILGLITAGAEANLLNRRGGIFVRPAHQLSHDDRILLQTVARVVISDSDGSLLAQVGRHVAPPRSVPLLLPDRGTAFEPMTDAGARQLQPAAPEVGPPADGAAAAAKARFDNGTGSFSADGREYVIISRADTLTPAPWANVIANPHFGTVVSESSSGYTWFENAHEFRLTPWHNDPIADASGEALYLRDEETGRVWSPTPLPCRGQGSYQTRHGFGYSVYEHVEDGIASELWIYVALDAAVKFSHLIVRNTSGRPRLLSVTGYVEWVLGDVRGKSQMHVVTEVDADTGALTAHNPYNIEFGGRVAFYDVDSPTRSFTADRSEFLGRNGHLGAPAALQRAKLSGAAGVGLDPCAAVQVPIALRDGESFETTFRLGAASDSRAATALAARYKGVEAAKASLAEVRAYWIDTLGAVQVETPDASVDLLVNGWLPYQTLSSRYFARSGYYQSGGAFGFRDQLQDVMAMVHLAPALCREHLLRSAAHQFPQGDVLHWWHPPLDRGVRTRCSDDYLWLPLAVSRYLETTGDLDVLEERVRFVEARALNVDEESYYDLPMLSAHQKTLYEHCELALRRGVELCGARGLPLMGSGDWNDGMNRVGIGGVGESVWLGFFLFDVLTRFGKVATARDDEQLAAWCRTASQNLRENLAEHAWDGEWYQRAWFDDGTPLGSRSSDECQIDSISQSWAVLSGAADSARGRQAMQSLDKHLVRRDDGLIQLLTPAFDKTTKDPGYIRGYVPGVRENGGQYTHAAVWAAMAFAELGDRERAWELARMINPIQHATDAAGVARYKVEPYVMAADVYALPPHIGRGGWTWYTGSAGWMYQLLTESLLGLRRHNDTISLEPRIPSHWPRYRIEYRTGASVYAIEVTQTDDNVATLALDGSLQPDLNFRLIDDGARHQVVVCCPR